MSPSAPGSSAGKDTQPPDPDRTLGLARRLIYVLGLRSEDDYRLAVLKRVARRLEDDYPEFLRLLLLVACSHDVRARQRMAHTLGIGLRRNDLPSGRLSSWGAATMNAPADEFNATELTGRFFKAPQRSLGPLEYLTVWHGQRTQRTALGDEAYAFALGRLVDLVNQDDGARDRYVSRLRAESEREIEGTYTGATRRAMRRMATVWQEGATPDEVAASAIGERAPSTGNPADWVIRPL
ncbi:MAG: hypothetical protein AAFU65_16605 [Pseudomonadota bacterium]